MIRNRRLGWADHVARIVEGRSVFKNLTGSLTGRRPLGKSRSRMEDNIIMNLKEIDINTRYWFDSAQDRR